MRCDCSMHCDRTWASCLPTQVRSEMGLGSKRQLSLPQTEQEGADALAEAVPDTKGLTCGLIPHAAYLLLFLREVRAAPCGTHMLKHLYVCHQYFWQDAHYAMFTSLHQRALKSM